jgi:hypothetical protein
MQLPFREAGESEGLKKARFLADQFLRDQLADTEHFIAVI